MRKITSLLMLFCAFVCSAWAGPTDLPEITTDVNNPIYYTILNTRSSQPGGYMYYAGDEVGLKDGWTFSGATLENKYKFYFTGSHDALYVHNAATGKKLASVGSWTEAGAVWAVGVSPKGGGLAFGPQGGLNGNNCWNEKNYTTDANTSDFTTWSANDDGSIFICAKVEDLCLPETGKFYVIEAPLFENVQGVKKAIYVNGEGNAVWGTEDLSNKNFYWVPTVKGDGSVALKNLGTQTYLSSTDGVMTAEEATATIKELGDNSFNIKLGGNTLHANNHSSGNGAGSTLTSWGGGIGSASAWMFVEKADPDAIVEVEVIYNFMYNGVEKTAVKQTVKTYIGEEYPVITTLPYGVSAVKPAGVIEEGDVVEGKVTKTIEVTDALPFVAAADYASIKNWYYIQMHSSNNYSKYIQAADGYIEWLDENMTAGESDSYTWAFIGNPFDGFKLVNYGAGADKGVNSTGSGNPALGDLATATSWTLKPSATNPTAQYFCFQYPGSNQYMNAQGGKIAFWGSADQGSTMWITERDLTGRADLQALVDAVEAAAPNYVAGEGIGYYTQASVDAVAAAVAAAKTALAGTMTAAISAQHQTAINNAVAGLVVNMPTPGAYYRLKNHFRNMYVSVDATGTRIQSAENNAHPSLIWTIEQNGETYKIKNLNHGENGYMKAPGGGNDLVDAASAASYTLRPLGDGQFNLVSGSNLVIFASGELGAWGDNPKDSDGAWYFEPATELEVVVTSAGYATLYLPFDVTLPNTVKAYAVETVHDGSVTLTEKADIPANTGAILEGEGTHTLTIAAATSDWSANKLAGTNVNTYVEGNSYVLGVDGEGASLFLAELNKDGEGAEGTTHFLNNANKAYLPVSTGSATQVLRFNFGETTGIESTIAGENGNAIIFDLSGRRVNKMQKGVYIVNGKKVYVK